MQAVAYRENIVPIRAKSIFLLQKLELRKSDSNRSKKVFCEVEACWCSSFRGRKSLRPTALRDYGLRLTGRKRHAICGPLLTGRSEYCNLTICP